MNNLDDTPLINTQFQQQQKTKLLKALDHLEYSYKKILGLPEHPEQLNEETLETWESFSARFSRVADIFLTKYLRTLVLLQDPGFSGTLRDFVNQGEKMGIVDHADAWMAIRELRNITAHDDNDQDLVDTSLVMVDFIMKKQLKNIGQCNKPIKITSSN